MTFHERRRRSGAAALQHRASRLSLFALATAAALVTLPVMPAAAAPPDGVRPERTVIAAPSRSIDVATLPAATQQPPAAIGKSYVAHPAPAPRQGPHVEPGNEVSLDDGPTTPGGTSMAQLNATDALGPSCTGCEPPDTQIAVGPSHAVQMVNGTARIYGKNLVPSSTFALSTFYGGPSFTMTAPSYSDPRVYYDARSSRFLSIILVHDRCGSGAPHPACNAGTRRGNSEVKLAITQTNNPSGSWWIYTIETNTAGVLFDQPRLGVNDDKVLITHDDFQDGTTFIGVKYTVVRKSDLVAGLGAALDLYARDSGKRWVIPARSLSTTTTAHATHASGSTMTVFRFTGVPGSGGSSFTTTALTIGSLAAPPDAVQPGTGSGLVDTGNANIQSVMWRSNTLWSAATESCTPSGDTTARACVRLVKVNTASTPTLSSDTRVSWNGNYLYFPSIVTTGSDDAFVGLTTSGASRYPSAAVMYGQGGTFGASIPITVYWSGTAEYTGSRWGDYSEIAVDPSNEDEVWAAQQHGANSTTPSNTWGTAIGVFTAVAPSITSISPSSGPTGGGTTVDIFGREFGMFSTVSWGGSSLSYTRISSTQLRVTAPARTAGSVSVTVSTSAGTSNAATYTYNGPTISSVSPNRGPNTGGQTVTITGNNFTNASSVTFGGTAASFTVNSNTQITATTPAHSNGTFDVRVTAGGTTSPITAADQYTFVTPPTVTGVSPAAGPTSVSQSVTITGTGFTGATVVTFGSNTASFTVVSSTQIVAQSPVVPVTSVGFVDVRVTANGLTSPTNTNARYLYV